MCKFVELSCRYGLEVIEESIMKMGDTFLVNLLRSSETVFGHIL